MSEHDWTEWPEEGPDFAEADTADLGDGYGETGFGDAGFDADALGVDGFEEPAHGEEPAEPVAAAPQPIGYGDAFAEEPVGAEPDAGHDAGLDQQPEPPAGDAGFGPAEDPPFGADPDVDPTAEDAGWEGLPFPEPLDLGGAPDPVDGYPWTDAALLGDGAAPLPDPATEATGTPEPRDLYAYAGEDVPAGGAGWSALVASLDPATSSLARWWAPGT
ncbi:MAG TPA: hypothetical protein VFR67_07395 [Pilimelia sp.]|nr:hypothetical protein [Pilimelia sp.]